MTTRSELLRLTCDERPTFVAPPVVLAHERTPDELRHERQYGGVVRLRRGAYAGGALAGEGQVLADARARAAIVAAHRRLTTPFWFSHASAALVWGCAVYPAPDATHIVQEHRPGGRGGDRSTLVRHHRPVPPSERAVVDGLPVTSLARTVLDGARTFRPDRALALVDSALRLGVDEAAVAALLAVPGGRGMRQARAVWAARDARAESPGESMTRWILTQAGIPPTALQLPVVTPAGVFYPDLCWPDVRLCVEFDGAAKYGTGADEVRARAAERRRQAALEDAGWWVLRVVWADLAEPDVLAERVRVALVRAGRRP